MNNPTELKYTKEHEWLRLNDDGLATIGITDFAQGELGDIVFVEINEFGEELDQDEVFGTVEAVKTVSELFLPIQGTVVEFNEKLKDNPELVNEDPYGEGWMVKIRPSNPADIESLLSAEEYSQIIS
ncbi:MAG: glycine cleavage system protein GcvH [Balneolaceae bacterium]|jgi:glycine cleavage system H protein|nr:MAG: glycine cleavage system protein GcvH [Balneolaceae bacterium]